MQLKKARFAGMTVLVLAAAMSWLAVTTPEVRAQAAAKEIIGEVVDPACWVVNGARGESHRECAIACAKAGQTLAILQRKTNKLFLLSTEKPGEDPNAGVIDFCGQMVLVKGRVFTRNSVSAIRIASIEPYSSK